MSASKMAKAAGLKNLDVIAAMLGATTDAEREKIKRRLANWHNRQPQWLNVMIAGCVAIQDKHQAQAAAHRQLVEKLTADMGYQDVTQLTQPKQLFDEARLYDFTARKGHTVGLFRVIDGVAMLIASYATS